MTCNLMAKVVIFVKSKPSFLSALRSQLLVVLCTPTTHHSFILSENNEHTAGEESKLDDDDDNKMMHMTFYWSKQVTVLFDSWKTDSWTSYSLTLLACFLASVFYQYMENRRIQFKLLASSSKSGPAIEMPLLGNKLVCKGMMSWVRIAGSVLFGVNSAIGYMLMLVVMSFNGGVFIGVVVGLAIGYWVFRSGDEDRVVVVDTNSCACA